MERSLTSTAVVVQANLDRADHQEAILTLTNAFALDPMGGSSPLPSNTQVRLIEGLRTHPTTLIFLAYIGSTPVGIATCFRGFSTFLAKPLLNIHDLAVVPTHRNKGIGQLLVSAVARAGKDSGCCKVTLEVQESNRGARHFYERVGFSPAPYGDDAGRTLFYTRSL